MVVVVVIGKFYPLRNGKKHFKRVLYILRSSPRLSYVEQVAIPAEIGLGSRHHFASISLLLPEIDRKVVAIRPFVAQSTDSMNSSCWAFNILWTFSAS